MDSELGCMRLPIISCILFFAPPCQNILTKEQQQINAILKLYNLKVISKMLKKKAKILVIGDTGAGKSTLVQAYAKKGYQFTSDYTLTQGVDVHSKIVPFPQDRTDVELFLFDMSGHEFYQTISMGMAKNPDLVMVVYDCTNVDSLKNGLKWLDKVKKINNKSALGGVLVGSKCEHKTVKQVSAEQGEKYAQKLGLQFFQVSAAYNTAVDQPFLSLAQQALRLSSTSIS